MTFSGVRHDPTDNVYYIERKSPVREPYQTSGDYILPAFFIAICTVAAVGLTLAYLDALRAELLRFRDLVAGGTT